MLARWWATTSSCCAGRGPREGRGFAHREPHGRLALEERSRSSAALLPRRRASQLGRFDEAIGHGEAACGSLKRPIIPSHCTAG